MVSKNKKHKLDLLVKIDVLDRKAETSLLSPQEVEIRHHLKGQLTKLLRGGDLLAPTIKSNKVIARG